MGNSQRGSQLYGSASFTKGSEAVTKASTLSGISQNKHAFSVTNSLKCLLLLSLDWSFSIVYFKDIALSKEKIQKRI